MQRWIRMGLAQTCFYNSASQSLVCRLAPVHWDKCRNWGKALRNFCDNLTLPWQPSACPVTTPVEYRSIHRLSSLWGELRVAQGTSLLPLLWMLNRFALRLSGFKQQSCVCSRMCDLSSALQNHSFLPKRVPARVGRKGQVVHFQDRHSHDW